MIIRDIIFFEETKKGKEELKAMIFFNDGNIVKATYEQAIEGIIKYAEQQKYTTMGEIEQDRHIKIWSQETFKNNIEDMIDYYHSLKESNTNNTNKNNTAKKNNNKKKNSTKKKKKKSIFSKIKNFFQNRKKKTIKLGKTKNNDHTPRKTNKKTKKEPFLNRRKNIIKNNKKVKNKKKKKRSILNWLIGLVSTAIIFGGAIIHRDIHKKQTRNKIEKELENNNERYYTKEYDSIYSALGKANMNEQKEKAVSSIWTYINNYNQTVARNHISSKTDTKLGLQWDEAVAHYIGYNNLSKDAYTKIFDNFTFDSEKMLKAYKRAHNQEVLAHTVQVESLEKENLIRSSEGKEFYLKYENILIKYNSCSNDQEKVKYAEKFYRNLKQDFNEETLTEIKNYKLSIMPMIEAMNNMTNNLELENKLTKKEKAYFKKLSSEEIVRDKFEKIANQLFSYQTATNAVNESINEISYEELRALAIKTLKKTDSYNVKTADARNIKDHKDYKENVNYKVTLTEDNNNDYDTINNNNNSESNTKTESKNDTEKKITKENKNDTSSIKTEETKNPTDNTNNDDNYYNIEPDTPTETPTEEEEYEQVENDESVQDTTTDSTGAVDENEPLPNPNNEVEESTDDSLITVTYINAAGINQEENYTISKNPSNEAVATEIVEEMAKQSTTNNNTPKTYTK